MNSKLLELGPVSFPAFIGERVYMLPFFQAEGLPAHLVRWQATIDQMLAGIVHHGKIFLMIDQSAVAAGNSQRRPGAHIDGYWVEANGSHGGTGGHSPRPPGHKPRAASWQSATFDSPEAILLASNVSASRALIGEFAGPIGDGGDCSHLDLSRLLSVPLAADRAYAGNVTMIHESLPSERNCQRSLVRLNIPGLELP